MHRFIVAALVIFGIAASAPQVAPGLFAGYKGGDAAAVVDDGIVPTVAQTDTSAAVSLPPAAEEVAIAVGPAASPARRGRTSIRASNDGHYYADAVINGRSAPVMVDTGATVVALTAETAKALGIVLGRATYTARVETANGVVRAAPVKLREIRIGGVRVLGVEALVLPQNALSTNLLGMSFLNRLEKFEAGSGELVLVQ